MVIISTYCMTLLTQNLSNFTLGVAYVGSGRIGHRSKLIYVYSSSIEAYNLVIYKMSIYFLRRLVLEVLLYM